MKYHTKKLALVAAVAIMVMAPSALANNATDSLKSNVGENIGPAKCVAKGQSDFSIFLDGYIYSDGLVEGVLEPWRDITSRNQCQVNDVTSLVKQRDKIKDQIRRAYLTCNNQQLPNLSKAFYRTNAEIYYVRHVVDSTIVANLPFNLLSKRLADDKEGLFYSPSKLKSEMRERYTGEGLMSDNEFDLFFANLETKYSDRKDQYVVCKNSSWEVFADRFKQFVDNWGGTKKALDNASRNLGGRAEKIVEAVTDPSFSNYAKGLFQARIAKLSTPTALKDIVKHLDKNTPGSNVPTQKQANSAVAVDASELDIEAEKESLAVQFEILYKTTSDATNKLFMEELDLLEKALNESYKPLDDLEQCTKTLNSKQCPSTR